MHRNGQYSFLITEFGAQGDGKTLNTEAIQKAIDICSSKGGEVIIPPGVFMSGTLELKSNIVIRLVSGAVLKASEKITDYRPNGFRHNEMGDTTSLLYAIGRTNIKITGEGEIDLSGDKFMDFNSLHPCDIPESEFNEIQRSEATVKFLERPTQPIFFHDCSCIGISGIAVKNSPCWTMTFSACKDIKIHKISIDNGLRIPNSDGMHFCSSKDIIVSDCIISSGDDCIAITGITDWDGISERIIISNCTMRSRSAAIRLGHLESKVRNIVISNIVIYESNRGMSLFAGNEGWIRDVNISDVILDTQIYAGAWWGKGEPMVICAADSNGSIKNISVSNVRAKSENSAVIVGNKGNVKDIFLSNWNVEICESKNRKLVENKLDIQPAKTRFMHKRKKSWLYQEEIENLVMRDVQSY